MIQVNHFIQQLHAGARSLCKCLLSASIQHYAQTITDQTDDVSHLYDVLQASIIKRKPAF